VGDPPIKAGAVALSVIEETTVVVPFPNDTVVIVSFPEDTVVIVSFPEDTVVPVKEDTVVPPATTVAGTVVVVVPSPSSEQSIKGMAKQVNPTSHPSPVGHDGFTHELASASV